MDSNVAIRNLPGRRPEATDLLPVTGDCKPRGKVVNQTYLVPRYLPAMVPFRRRADVSETRLCVAKSFIEIDPILVQRSNQSRIHSRSKRNPVARPITTPKFYAGSPLTNGEDVRPLQIRRGQYLQAIIRSNSNAPRVELQANKRPRCIYRPPSGEPHGTSHRSDRGSLVTRLRGGVTTRPAKWNYPKERHGRSRT